MNPVDCNKSHDSSMSQDCNRPQGRKSIMKNNSFETMLVIGYGRKPQFSVVTSSSVVRLKLLKV